MEKNSRGQGPEEPCAEPSAIAPDTGHARRVQGLFTSIAGIYDIMNRIFSLGFDALWRKSLADAVLPATAHADAVILDLAAGTLEVTVELVRRHPESRILAADFCPTMLSAGRKKIALYPNISLLAGDACALPLPDSSIDAITVAFGLRNFKPRSLALAEAARVLKPGGMLAVLEFGSARDRILFGVYNWYLARVMPLIGRLVSKDKGAYQYLAETIAAFPSAEELAEEFAAAGFSDSVFSRYTAGIVCIHTGRKR